MAARIDHLNTAHMVVNRFGRANIIFSNSFFWRWEERGVWVKISDREIKKVLHELLRGKAITRNVIESIVDMVKTEASSRINLAEHCFYNQRNTINCISGELVWSGDTFTLNPHTRDNYHVTQIPIVFDPHATAPRFVQFLYEVFGGDLDLDNKVMLTLEVIGYTLLQSCEFEKFVMLIGPGANGKSVLMETVANLLGRDNVSAVQPSQFVNRFQIAHLHGKLANMITEIAEGHVIADAALKAIVSGELITAEHKHRAPFEFKPFCTCWFGTNHMPRTTDFSEALFRRAIILTFNRRFSEREQDKHLKEKLRSELPGILNIAVGAIAEVIKRGEFTLVSSVEEAKKEWRLTTDQVAQFVQ